MFLDHKSGPNHGTLISCYPITDLGIFWYCSRDFWSYICESPDSVIEWSQFFLLCVV